jgi:hypothetical protein
MKPPVVESKTVVALRWSGRILAALLFLLWGSFFVEHTIEWFVKPLPQTPPWFVWATQALHLLMLVGLVALWRWEVVGSGLLLLAAFGFFVVVGGPKFAVFFGVTAIPALLVLASRWQALHGRRAAPAAT